MVGTEEVSKWHSHITCGITCECHHSVPFLPLLQTASDRAYAFQSLRSERASPTLSPLDLAPHAPPFLSSRTPAICVKITHCQAVRARRYRGFVKAALVLCLFQVPRGEQRGQHCRVALCSSIAVLCEMLTRSHLVSAFISLPFQPVLQTASDRPYAFL